MAGGVNAIGNLLGKVNANGALIVALDGGTASATLFLAGDGSASAPSYSFASAPTYGMYLDSGANIRFAVAGTFKGQWNANGLDIIDNLRLGSSVDVSLSRGAANRLDLAAGDSFSISATGSLGVGTVPTATSFITTGAGTTAIAPLTITNGTNLTNAAANAIENDGAAFYKTQDTTNGRTYWDGWNYFSLTGSGSGISTIADFFGANDGIPLVSGGQYEIEWYCWFSQATAGTATWTIVTATTALASLNASYLGSNIAGIGTVGAPQMAGVVTTASSSTALPVTGSEANAATHYFEVKAKLTAGAGASNTRLRLTMSAGTATPLIHSFFRVRRLSGGNVGAYVA